MSCNLDLTLQESITRARKQMELQEEKSKLQKKLEKITNTISNLEPSAYHRWVDVCGLRPETDEESVKDFLTRKVKHLVQGGLSDEEIIEQAQKVGITTDSRVKFMEPDGDDDMGFGLFDWVYFALVFSTKSAM